MDVVVRNNPDIVELALVFATMAHAGQKRKYTGEDYIVHPVEVKNLVKELYPEADNAMLADALLHDVVEDTPVTLEEILRGFGQDVHDLVSDLTDVSKPSDGNRAKRKAIDREHTANASKRAKIIKACDLISNTASIVAYDKDFAHVYLKEKRALVQVMRDIDPNVFAGLERMLNVAEGMLKLGVNK